MQKKRGLFIVFEGLDRAGKSTQAKLLQKYFNLHEEESKLLIFPDRETEIGKMISAYLKSGINLSDEVIHLLFSANRWEQKDKIVSILNSGTNIICDRYAFSGVAYSAAKGLDIQWCKAPDKGLPRPDLVILLDIGVEHIKERGEFGEERYEKEEMQINVAKYYEEMFDSKYWYRIPAHNSEEVVQQQITDLIDKLILEKKEKQIPICHDLFF